MIGGLVAVTLVAIGLAVSSWRSAPASAPVGAIATLQTGDFHALAFDPTNARVAFFGHHNGVLRTDDGGRTWRPLVERPNFDAMSMAVSRGNAQRLYLAGHDIFQTSLDGGVTWRPVAHNLPGTDTHAFAVSPDDSDWLYAVVVGRGAFQSADGGKTWTPLGGGLPGDVMALVAVGGAPERLYAGGARSGIMTSLDGGETWARASSVPGSPGVMALAVDPAAGQTVYAGTEGGLFKTTDGGRTWVKLAFPGDNVVALAVSPSDSNVLLAIAVANGRGLVYRSEDGGQTWGGRG